MYSFQGYFALPEKELQQRLLQARQLNGSHSSHLNVFLPFATDAQMMWYDVILDILAGWQVCCVKMRVAELNETVFLSLYLSLAIILSIRIQELLRSKRIPQEALYQLKTFEMAVRLALMPDSLCWSWTWNFKSWWVVHWTAVVSLQSLKGLKQFWQHFLIEYR